MSQKAQFACATQKLGYDQNVIYVPKYFLWKQTHQTFDISLKNCRCTGQAIEWDLVESLHQVELHDILQISLLSFIQYCNSMAACTHLSTSCCLLPKAYAEAQIASLLSSYCHDWRSPITIGLFDHVQLQQLLNLFVQFIMHNMEHTLDDWQISGVPSVSISTSMSSVFPISLRLSKKLWFSGNWWFLSNMAITWCCLCSSISSGFPKLRSASSSLLLCLATAQEQHLSLLSSGGPEKHQD